MVKLSKAGSRTIRSEIHKHINSIWNKKELPEQSINVPIYKKGDETDCSNYQGTITEAYHFRQLHTTPYPTSFC